MKTSLSRSRPRPRHGFALLEALVGLLIFSFAILGLVGLQGSMTRAQSTSQYRATSASLASDLIGQMWSDTAHLSNYADANCASYDRCKSWADKVAAELPSGAPSVAINGGAVTITVAWTVPGESAPSQYVTATSIH